MLGTHEAEHGPEALRAVEEGPAAHSELDPRRPEVRVPADQARLEEPLLALVEARERASQRFTGRLGERCDPARCLPRAADVQARRRIPELATKDRIVIDLGLTDREARR